MLKKITLVAMFLFGSAVTTASARPAHSTTGTSKAAAPTAPVPHGLKCANSANC